MKKQFVSYEIAKQLKELGFKDDCLGYYTTKYDYSATIFEPKFYISENIEECLYIRRTELDCLAPLYQQVIYFLYKIYEVVIRRSLSDRNWYEVYFPCENTWIEKGTRLGIENIILHTIKLINENE